MSWSSRRASILLTAVGLLVGLSLVQAQRAKEVPFPIQGPGDKAPKDKKANVHDLGRLTLSTDKDDLKVILDSAEDHIKRGTEEELKRAIELLQAQVGRKDDFFVPRERKDKNGENQLLYVSMKKEAARLIGDLSPAGRKLYQDLKGESAEKLLKSAKANNDYEQMTQVASLYLYTKEGAEATSWLATNQLGRGNFQGASTFYQILINRSDIANLGTGQLFKAAFAMHQAGDPGSLKVKAQILKELKRRKAEYTLADKETKRSVEEFETALAAFVPGVSSENAGDSPMYRSRPNRTPLLAGGTPFLEPQWTYKMADEGDDKDDKEKKTAAAKVNAILKEAIDNLKTGGKEAYCAYSPVTATATKKNGTKQSLLVFRTFGGVMAVDVRTGKRVWETEMDLSPFTQLGIGKDTNSTQGRPSAYKQWWDNWKPNGVRPQIMLENSVQGTLSADNKHVYAVEDVPVPAPQNMIINNPYSGQAHNFSADALKSLESNKLYAMSSVGGRVRWEIGGSDEKDPKLVDSLFLSPPLPLNNKLYVLSEQKQELRLVVLDPDGKLNERGDVIGPKVISIQSLAHTKDLKLAHDPLRRVQACHLASAEGVLVIPTNAGAVFGIDLLTGSLAWAYPYSEKPNVQTQPQQPYDRFGNFRNPGPGWVWLNNRWVKSDQNTHWQVTAPAIQDGKAVFTAPDARDIHCVNLRDGTRVWSRSRDENDLYMAGVYNGKVVVVGKHRTRALKLSNGNVEWELETGLPSGQGAASLAPEGGDVLYYLPIRKATNTGEPEICAINVDKGLIHAHTRSRQKVVPGNLLFYEGRVMSQNFDVVTAFPQLEVKLAELAAQLKDSPNDPKLLTSRGDYLLDRGDLAPAILDFRKALRTEGIKDDTRQLARTKLYEAYTEYFQRDFNKAEQYLADYEEMCKVELGSKTGQELTAAKAENRRRRMNFLCLVGKGREAQNKLVDAFKSYLELGQEAEKGELIQVVDEPSVKAAPDVWSQGRIGAMIANSKDAGQKAEVEKLIQKKWDEVKGKKDIDELRKFVGLFGSTFSVGKDARFALADRLVEDPAVNSMLEAEQHLSLLRNDPTPAIAARATETLARLSTRKGLLDDAAYFYRILGEKYGKISIDGKNGEDYLEDLANDKRFLPYLDQAGRFTIKGPVRVTVNEEKGNFYNQNWNYPLHNFGEQLPFFLRNRLMFTSNRHSLELHDAANDDARWSLTLPQTQFEAIAARNTKASRAEFGFQTQGHLTIMTMGHRVFAVDPLNKGRVVWDKNLSQLPGSGTTPPAPMEPFTYDHRDGSVLLRYTDGAQQRVGGNSGCLRSGVVCLQYRDSMEVVDPVTGRTLWTRADVNSRAHVFGDEGYLYVVGMTEGGQATTSRVYRAKDGVSVVGIADFSGIYEKRARVMGRHILASDADAKGVLTVRIYDILLGKDLYKQTYAQGATLMQSEDPRLAGVLEPNGDVHVIDVVTQKEVVKTSLLKANDLGGTLETKNWADPQSVHLVSDPDMLFVAINNKLDSNEVSFTDQNGILPNFHVGRGLRSIPVNGWVCGFERNTGKLRWANEVKNEHLLMTSFQELPLLVFAARYNKMQGARNGPRNPTAISTVQVYTKSSGKMVYMPDSDNKQVHNSMHFSGVNMDHRTGKVDLIGDAMKIHLQVVPK